MMTMNAQDVAWIKAQSLYCKGDLVNLATIKALEFGYMPGTESHAAFIAGFEEMVNNNTILKVP